MVNLYEIEKIANDIDNQKDTALTSAGIDIERANTDQDYYNEIMTSNMASGGGTGLDAANQTMQSDVLSLMKDGFIPLGWKTNEQGETSAIYKDGERKIPPNKIADGGADSSSNGVPEIKSMKEIVVERANNGTLDQNGMGAWNEGAVAGIVNETLANKELSEKIGETNAEVLSQEAIKKYAPSLEDDVVNEYANYTGQTSYPNYGPPGTVSPGGPPGTGSVYNEKTESKEVDDKVYVDDPNTGDASVAEQVYESQKKPEEFYHPHYKRNILLDYDTPTYHWKLSMLTERDTVSAQEHINRGNRVDDGFQNWTPEDSKIVIAETGGTVLTLNSAEIITTAGPVNNGKRITGAVDFTLNILQPLNASFTDTLVNSAIALGIPDGLKATYLLELHFIGRVPEGRPDLGMPGEIINPIPLTERQFLIEIVYLSWY